MTHYCLEKEIGELLLKNNLTLGLAESCTGGLIGNLITNVPGSSGYFIGGVIAYSNKMKIEMLGVSQKTLDMYGAVSEETAVEMAIGIRGAAIVDIGLAVTGIAGPEYGTEEKPVGTIYIVLSDGIETRCRRFCFEGTRLEIKAKTAENALLILKNYLMEKYRG
ncbi:MAG: hypothetical protein A2073_00120 [Deltaproteobacteria bacterium GWC2_42_11]|nr:MAG: hypothetical protein A2073_00120 [Deltaproteobacteria bacterium GWC2_42_11]HBO83607.1 damage-inducible protein CinA [Deltaproteobacteria bacterium]HBU05569.1 damage-inducible protein CinA [Nitrospiraceae bacterium]